MNVSLMVEALIQNLTIMRSAAVLAEGKEVAVGFALVCVAGTGLAVTVVRYRKGDRLDETLKERLRKLAAYRLRNLSEGGFSFDVIGG